MEYGYNEKKIKKGVFPKIKKVMGKVPFVPDIVTIYFCALDSKTPIKAKIIAFSALAYFIAPIDAIPDVAAGIGYTDDAAAITAAVTSIQMYITDEHRSKAEEWLNSNC